MRVQSPDFLWTGIIGSKDRILSIDFHPLTSQFATGGSQTRKYVEGAQQDPEAGCIKLWTIQMPFKLPTIKCGIPQATSNVNVVKYSPNGHYLASGSDGSSSVTLWVQKQTSKSFSNNQRVRRWCLHANLNGHQNDVIDLRWTRDSKFLISGSMDKSAIIWDIQTKIPRTFLINQHAKFVQGVCIDPRSEYALTVSNDQSVKFWSVGHSAGSKKGVQPWFLKKTIKDYYYDRGIVEQGQDEGGQINKKQSRFKMFANQSVASFFRRPDISPDGQLFILPTGIWKSDKETQPICCAYLFRKNYFEKPSFVIQTSNQPALVCKFCPILFKKKNPEGGLFKQSYYMVFAIATTNSVLIYNTQNLKPLYGMGNYHYSALTDLAWKNDEVLAISSSDGYISFMIFDKGELGQKYEPQGQLKELLTIPPYMPKVQNKKNIPSQNIVLEQKTEIIHTQNGGIKKKIIPKTVVRND